MSIISISSHGQRHGSPTRGRGARALTLLEMMVSVTLLAIIMLGLLAMFTQTQRALHVAHTQTDVFENARGAMQIVARDLAEMSSYEQPEVVSAFLGAAPSPIGELQTLTRTQQLTFAECFWLSRVNDEWRGLGFFVSEDSKTRNNIGVGTLYRYSELTNRGWAPMLTNRFLDPNVEMHRVSDGIVHFELTAVYPVGNSNTVTFNSSSAIAFTNVLPAFVDIEIGVLEPNTLKQFQAFAADATVAAAQNFLANNASRVHFFRERVPIRNFVNPFRANEVP